MQPALTINANTLHIHLAANDQHALLSTIAEPVTGQTDRFTLSADGELVTDHKTGLMWPVYESEKAMDVDALAKYIAAFRLGGFGDWFNPSAERRESIRDLSRYKPALFPPFKSRSNGWEWTCTPCAWSMDDAGVPSAFWQVGGNNGHLHYGNRYNEAFARPCRFVARAGQ